MSKLYERYCDVPATMTICFFGYPNQIYSRNKILIDGLHKNDIKVIYCTDKSGLFLIRYWRLFKKFLPLHHNCDVIFVQFPGHLNVPIAWVLGKLFRKPVILDAFISLYDTYVFDRQSVKLGSPKAKFYWWVDKLACTLADAVTLDTNAHIRYFIRTFKLPRRKFYRLPVGGDETLFRPAEPRRSGVTHKKIIIEFHAMFTRLHGAEIFVKAAKKLEKYSHLEFWLIGSSDNFKLPINLYHQLKPQTLKYWSEMPVQKLARKISQADISVAHLGPTQKARMVLTNKMFHALASGVALIAGDNPATREFLQHKKTCLLVNMYDETDLARKILLLSRNRKFRQKIATQGYQLHQQKFTNQQLGLELLQIIRKHLLHIG